MFLHQLPEGIISAGNTVAFAQFKTACFQVARESGLKVTEVWRCGENKTADKSSTYDNYHAALFVGTEYEVWVLCNSSFPYLGFTAEWTLFSKEFIDSVKLSECFLHFTEFQPLDSSFLNYPFVKQTDAHFLAQLGKSEIDNVMRWSPDRVGDALFNEWD